MKKVDIDGKWVHPMKVVSLCFKSSLENIWLITHYSQFLFFSKSLFSQFFNPKAREAWKQQEKRKWLVDIDSSSKKNQF
jgi:hypothetical protein